MSGARVVGPDGLTDRQRQVYEIIRGHCLAHGVPPTVRAVIRELGAASPNAIVHHLAKLLKLGLLRRVEGKRIGGTSGRSPAYYVPTNGELVVERTADGVEVRASVPVVFTREQWRAWLRKQVAES